MLKRIILLLLLLLHCGVVAYSLHDYYTSGINLNAGEVVIVYALLLPVFYEALGMIVIFIASLPFLLVYKLFEEV